ncbi:MAG: protein-methionine-sulfoxide reductase heme-binding subunit MsrQ [Maricaulis sp.]|uniref:sulfite oxidase heme-binding subunit YedZ n=1 Tax=Maricaulis sp. TaxID=1486257 RepID=UPI0026048734|nr:protein-methionine-sulfoxide reductase heme-binding subunit MsrQ [Maricaulis sp.]MDM7982917.1 protein-methionine-sulfoxide reductase heme-binding subunit MsrQ [Maricaulis sp.]
MRSQADMLRQFARHGLKPLAFWLLALPGLWLAWQWWGLLSGGSHALGFNPIETTHRFLGDTALRILILSLAISPFRDLTRWSPIMKIRRRVGLAAFWYALLHLLAYMGLDLLVAAQGSVTGMFAGLWDDVVERIYITLGMIAILGLIPLALTSFNFSIRQLGATLWQRLHLSVYPIAVLAVFHYGFMVKGHQLGPWLHGGILAVLLTYRAWRALRQHQSRRKLAA